jgi:dolichol-phosphate mannosyltransferase
LADDIHTALSQFEPIWECLWIDDGSQDNSLENIKALCRGDGRHRYLRFVRNAGQSAALWAGLQNCAGQTVATLDGDRQNDPADIPMLYKALMTGDVDMVNGYRQKRKDTIVRKIASRIANGFRNLTTGKTVRDVGCSTRIFKRQCVAHLPQFKGMHRFLPTLVSLQGYRISEIPVNHRPRTGGQSKYSISNRLWVGLYDVFGVMWLKKRAFHYQIDTCSRDQKD